MIDIAASGQRIDVDNRISLKFYYRIANNILKQADIYRSEKNIIDLYVMLLRFSSLAVETIPSHRDYEASSPHNKEYLRNRSLYVLSELEKLKPAVQLRISDFHGKHTGQGDLQGFARKSASSESLRTVKPGFSINNESKAVIPSRNEFGYNSSSIQSLYPLEDHSKRVPIYQKFSESPRRSVNFVLPQDETLSRHSILGPNGLHGHWQPPKNDIKIQYPSNIAKYGSVNFVLPHNETLSRHSILGPNGLHGHWQPPKNDIKIQYPSNIDLTPVEIPRLCHPSVKELVSGKDHADLAQNNSLMEPNVTVTANNSQNQTEDLSAMISFEEIERPADNITRQPSPPPLLAEVKDLVPTVSSQGAEVECSVETTSRDDLPPDFTSDGWIESEVPIQLHIPTSMMDTFMKFAKSNTVKNLETCGVLAGSLKDRKFYVTALIIPKQESTSDSCQTTNEEDIFEVQDKRSLFPLGWIHTHPTQSCFMSSIDVHTHYSYQMMLPEAVAIVMAPKDASRQYGIFRLTTPGGMSVIKQCQRRGFHPHDPPPDGGPIYKSCTDVFMNPTLNFDVIDLR